MPAMMPVPNASPERSPRAAGGKRHDLLRLMRWLQGLEDREFHGKITLAFTAGNLTYVKKEQGFSPDDDLD